MIDMHLLTVPTQKEKLDFYRVKKSSWDSPAITNYIGLVKLNGIKIYALQLSLQILWDYSEHDLNHS